MNLRQKLAEVETALVTAAALGEPHLHSAIFKKFAELEMDEADLDAVMSALADEQEKNAGVWDTMMNPRLQSAVGMGAMLSVPLMAGANMLLGKAKHDAAKNSLMQAIPELVSRDPQRVDAIFEMLYQTAPNIAGNTLIAADLVKQMMSMPMIDLGTVSKLIDIAKSRAQSTVKSPSMLSEIAGAGSAVSQLGNALQGVKAAHICTDGTKTFFDWGSDNCKVAGITDAFQGNGTTMEQANNASQFNQMDSGLLPLDNVVKELLAKEQELAQREEIIAQHEQHLQEMQQMMQQMGSQYQQETGVDPDTGEVAPEEEMPAEEEVAPEGEMPAEGEIPEGEVAPEGEMPEEVPAEGEMPEGEAPVEGEMPTEGEMPEEVPAEGEMPEAAAEEGAPEGEEVPEEAPAEGEVAPEGEMPEGEEVPEEAPAEGEMPEGEEAPEGEDSPAEGEEEEPKAPSDEHDMAAIEEGEAKGPNTAESVDGTPEDEMHDAANKVEEEGSEEDNIADKELASVLNAGGHQATPPAAPAAPAAQSQEIVLPLRISIKVGELFA
jgi:hypothetical protein